MRCFKHPENEAVGSCKHCNKGLCVECAHDLGHGLACKNEHEQQVETLNSLIEKNAEIYDSAPTNTLIAPLFYACMGALFVWFGVQSRGGFGSFSSLMGIGFIIFAIVVFIRNRMLFGKPKKTAK